MVKIGIAKTGNITTSIILEHLLDERADREDIEIRVFSSGPKMREKDCREILSRVIEYNPDIIIYITPNASLKHVQRNIEKYLTNKNAVIISDAPSEKIVKKLEELNLGYIIVKGDPMIGARREFLDPIEMAIFNASMLKILSIIGVLRIILEEVDKTIDALKKGSKYLPKMIIDSNTLLSKDYIKNPYAKSLIYSIYETLIKVGEINVTACFVEKDWKKYTYMVSSTHLLLQKLEELAEEIRRMEIYNDDVLRTPHHRDGSVLMKRKLIEKPK